MISTTLLGIVQSIMSWIQGRLAAIWPASSVDHSSSSSFWAWMGTLNQWVPITDLVVIVGILAVWVTVSLLIKLTLKLMGMFVV